MLAIFLTLAVAGAQSPAVWSKLTSRALDLADDTRAALTILDLHARPLGEVITLHWTDTALAALRAQPRYPEAHFDLRNALRRLNLDLYLSAIELERFAYDGRFPIVGPDSRLERMDLASGMIDRFHRAGIFLVSEVTAMPLGRLREFDFSIEQAMALIKRLYGEKRSTGRDDREEVAWRRGWLDESLTPLTQRHFRPQRLASLRGQDIWNLVQLKTRDEAGYPFAGFVELAQIRGVLGDEELRKGAAPLDRLNLRPYSITRLESIGLRTVRQLRREYRTRDLLLGPGIGPSVIADVERALQLPTGQSIADVLTPPQRALFRRYEIRRWAQLRERSERWIQAKYGDGLANHLPGLTTQLFPAQRACPNDLSSVGGVEIEVVRLSPRD